MYKVPVSESLLPALTKLENYANSFSLGKHYKLTAKVLLNILKFLEAKYGSLRQDPHATEFLFNDENLIILYYLALLVPEVYHAKLEAIESHGSYYTCYSHILAIHETCLSSRSITADDLNKVNQELRYVSKPNYSPSDKPSSFFPLLVELHEHCLQLYERVMSEFYLTEEKQYGMQSRFAKFFPHRYHYQAIHPTTISSLSTLRIALSPEKELSRELLEKWIKILFYTVFFGNIVGVIKVFAIIAKNFQDQNIDDVKQKEIYVRVFNENLIKMWYVAGKENFKKNHQAFHWISPTLKAKFHSAIKPAIDSPYKAQLEQELIAEGCQERGLNFITDSIRNFADAVYGPARNKIRQQLLVFFDFLELQKI